METNHINKLEEICNQVETDETFDFFERVLLKYISMVNCETSSNFLIDKNDDNYKYFQSLIREYNTSKSKFSDNWNSLEKDADDFTFYVSTGLIKITNLGYEINVNELIKLYGAYQKHNQIKNNGEVLVKTMK